MFTFFDLKLQEGIKLFLNISECSRIKSVDINIAKDAINSHQCFIILVKPLAKG